MRSVSRPPYGMMRPREQEALFLVPLWDMASVSSLHVRDARNTPGPAAVASHATRQPQSETSPIMIIRAVIVTCKGPLRTVELAWLVTVSALLRRFVTAVRRSFPMTRISAKCSQSCRSRSISSAVGEAFELCATRGAITRVAPSDRS